VPFGQDAAPANHATIAYNSPVEGNNSLETFRFPVTPNDKVYVRASTADISFTLSGIDNTNVSGTEYETVLALVPLSASVPRITSFLPKRYRPLFQYQRELISLTLRVLQTV